MRRAARGFTLVEAMMVLAVVAVLAALAAPSLQAMLAEQRVRSAAADYVGALRRAQIEAMSRNRPVEVLHTAEQASPADAHGAQPVSAALGCCRLVRAAGAAGASDFVASTNWKADTPGVAMDAASPRVLGFTATGQVRDFSGGTPAALTGWLAVRFVDPASARRMCAVVSPGGSARVCDPLRSANTPTACPADLSPAC